MKDADTGRRLIQSDSCCHRYTWGAALLCGWCFIALCRNLILKLHVIANACDSHRWSLTHLQLIKYMAGGTFHCFMKHPLYTTRRISY